MSRRIAVCVVGSLFAAAAACAPASHGEHRNAVHAGTDPNGGTHGDPSGENDDDSTEQPGQPPPDGGPGNDGGTGTDGGSASSCADAPMGWRSMSAMPSADPTSNGWTRSVAWTGHEMFARHGWSDSCGSTGCTTHQEAFSYDPVADVWHTVPLPPGGEARYYFYEAALDGRWIVFGGGLDKTPGFLLDGAVFDPTTKAWTTIPAAPLSTRNGYAMVASTTTHEIIVWGGFLEDSSGSSAAKLYADGAAYSLVTGKWRMLAGSPLPGGGAGFVSWDGARMILAYPETVTDGLFPEKGAAAYDPSTDAWQTLPLPSIAARVMMASVSVDRPASARTASAMWGGFVNGGDGDASAFRDGAWFDPMGGGWTTIPDPGKSLLATDRDRVASFGAHGRMYIWGGEANIGTSSVFVGDGLVYDLKTGIWSKMPDAGAPTARREAIAVWTGCDAVVFGGLVAKGSTLEGARFRP